MKSLEFLTWKEGPLLGPDFLGVSMEPFRL